MYGVSKFSAELLSDFPAKGCGQGVDTALEQRNTYQPGQPWPSRSVFVLTHVNPSKIIWYKLRSIMLLTTAGLKLVTSQ
jgi:hypothetical protein